MKQPEYALCNERIVVNPAILAGKPVVKGTRISVELVLEKLAFEPDLQTLFRDYPRLTLEDVRAYLQYAHALVAGEDVFPAVEQSAGTDRSSA